MQQTYLLAAAFCCLLTTSAAQAQTTPGGVRIGAAGPPDAKAILDISATGKGLLIPRMDSVTRAAIGTPPDGLMVFQTDGRKGFWYAMSGGWLFIPDKARAGDNLGNHTATKNINLTTNKLVGGTAASPGTVGLSIDGNGLVKLAGVYDYNIPNNGIGLHLTDADAGLLVEGTLGQGTRAPVSGAGERLMWAPYAAAFRAGSVSGTQWDAENIGFYSAAFGQNNLVDGNWAMSSGLGNKVDGPYNVGMGLDNSTDGSSSATLAFGRQCRTKGSYSIAGGYLSKTQGIGAVALGERCTANADNAVVLGRYASANSRPGTFTIGDASTTTDTLRPSFNNQFSARYAGGYRLFTNSTTSTGVSLNAGGSSWNVVSDSTKKELRRPVDGNAFLARINRMRLDSWNYIGQDPRTFRHYGPMAQDFFAAFGHDALGVIGNDTSIAQADFDGVNLIAIQALYRRVLTLEATNARLQEQVQQLQTRQPALPTSAPTSTAALEERLRRLEAQLAPQARR